ncbi:MAG: succinate dehydrogenase cytochrome b subunit [Kofleriaceae bacterium]
MSWFARYVRSSIGAKHVMAVTGLLLLLFAIVHMVGHLQMFGGPELYNPYANFLQNLWEVKWPVRAGLLALLVIHMITAIGLVAKNRAARPVGYAMYKPVRSSAPARAMAFTGLALFAFLAFHILHFTMGQIHPEHFHTLDAKQRIDAYAMFVHGFQHVWIYAVYLGGMILLALHLGHGASSWAQSLGWRHPKWPVERIGMPISIVLFVGYMLPPTAVLVGIIR